LGLTNDGCDPAWRVTFLVTGERYNLEIRGEAFGVTNTARFDNPE
jgi:hypothetical protein